MMLAGVCVWLGVFFARVCAFPEKNKKLQLGGCLLIGADQQHNFIPGGCLIIGRHYCGIMGMLLAFDTDFKELQRVVVSLPKRAT